MSPVFFGEFDSKPRFRNLLLVFFTHRTEFWTEPPLETKSASSPPSWDFIPISYPSILNSVGYPKSTTFLHRFRILHLCFRVVLPKRLSSLRYCFRSQLSSTLRFGYFPSCLCGNRLSLIRFGDFTPCFYSVVSSFLMNPCVFSLQHRNQVLNSPLVVSNNIGGTKRRVFVMKTPFVFLRIHRYFTYANKVAPGSLPIFSIFSHCVFPLIGFYHISNYTQF